MAGRRFTVGWVALASSTAVVMAAAAAGVPASAAGSGTTSWNLAWQSDFSGAAGSSPSGWTFENGGGGWGNEEQEYYVDSTQNATTQNAVLDGSGDLAITVRNNTDPSLTCAYSYSGANPPGTMCGYTSARLDTSALITAEHGRLEARIKLPAVPSGGDGIWPAFWAVGTNIGTVGWPTSGEIDTMEDFASNTQVAGHLHGPIAGTSNPVQNYGPGVKYTLPSGQWSSGWHTFAADWFPDHISFSVDGHIYGTIYKANLPSGDTWVFDHPFYLRLNVAVGSSLTGSWAKPTSASTLPLSMLVNYVKIYTYGPPTVSSTGPVTGEAGRCLDDHHSGTADGNPIDLWSCNGTDAQKWTFETDGTVRDFGKCLHPSGDSAAIGTHVVLSTCDGAAAEEWQIESDGSLANPNSGLCLDDYHSGTTDGNPIDIWSCNGTAAQIWTYP